MFAVLMLGVFGLFGWYFGRYYHHPTVGLNIGLFTAGITYVLATVDGIFTVIGEAIVAFVLGVPLIYGLVLLTETPSLAFGLTPFSAHTFFVRSFFGALVGGGICIVFSLRYVFAKGPASDPTGLNKLFWMGVSFRTSFAFLFASMFVIPEHNAAAMILFGTVWGILAAASQSFFTVLVDREPVREGWFLLLIVESLLIGSLTLALYDLSLLAAVIPAALACPLAYGLVCLAAKWRATPAWPTAALLARRTSAQRDVTSAQHDVPPVT